MRLELTSIIEYSPSMKNANFIPEYSVWNPATSSDSASGRSNGTRLFSAFIATKKMKHATICGSTFQTLCSWYSTIFTRSSEPVSISTPTIERPNGTSYETICAAERRPPISEYLLLEAQPPRMIPYTAVEVSARISSSPTLTRAAMNVGGGPNGIRKKTTNAASTGRV